MEYVEEDTPSPTVSEIMSQISDKEVILDEEDEEFVENLSWDTLSEESEELSDEGPPQFTKELPESQDLIGFRHKKHDSYNHLQHSY